MSGNDQARTGPRAAGELARRVRRRRGELGLTLDEVASRAGLDPAYLDRVEHAPVALTVGALIRLADALDTRVSDLLRSQPERPPGRGPAASHPVLTEMRERECQRLIESGGIGRVAFELAGRLLVLPVNFTVHDGAIVFRTGATTAVGRYGEGPVAFEVDRIDDGLQEGWSVLISGKARHADADETYRLAEEVDVEPWAGGDREVYVLIEPDRISGRRVRAW